MIHTYVMANVLTEARSYERADACLAEALKIGKHAKSELAYYLYFAMKSLMCSYTGDDTAFAGFFKEVVQYTKQNGTLFLTCLAAGNISICKKALNLGIEVDYVKSLIKSFGMTADESCLEIKDWPWQIKIYALGRFQIQVDETPVSFSGKVQKWEAVSIYNSRLIGKDSENL